MIFKPNAGKRPNLNVKPFVIGAVVLVSTIVCWPFVTVPSGNVGVMTTFSKASTEVYNPGLHLKVPFIQSMNNVYVGTYKAESDVGGSSKDLQSVSMKISINFSIEPQAAVSVYTTLGNNPWGQVMDPAIHDIAKAVAARYEATDLIQKRDQVSQEMREALMNRFRNIGVTVSAVNIVNLEFSKQFDAAIEAKITAQQNALRVENEVAQTKFEAQKRIVDSAADLQVAENKAKANALLGQSLQANPLLVEMKKIDKWDGHYPQYMMGSGVPLIQLPQPK